MMATYGVGDHIIWKDDAKRYEKFKSDFSSDATAAMKWELSKEDL
jgi:hypothetical protein